MIYKLTKQGQAEWIIRRLPSVWTKLNWLVEQLLKESRTTFSTMDLITEKNGQQSFYKTINSFYTANQAWFDENYPLYSDALAGAVSGLQKINDIINNGLRAYYWDEISDKPVVADMNMQHRIILADLIKSEIE